MKYIEVDKDELIISLRNFLKKQKEDEGHFISLFKSFIEDPDVRDCIVRNDIKTLYAIFDKSEFGETYVISCLNEFLIAADIDILEFIDVIPEDCFFSFNPNANLKITVPKHIKFIGDEAFFGMGSPTISYEGTMEEFRKIYRTPKSLKDLHVVRCSDGVIEYNGAGMEKI